MTCELYCNKLFFKKNHTLLLLLPLYTTPCPLEFLATGLLSPFPLGPATNPNDFDIHINDSLFNTQ